ncbi:methyltransferase type 11 [Rhodobacteraceae bacterium (ex Bugula neritina AB1)]|nr:methyltransferase type 11 [Rhodobacteraceae bacterium (ex Bugula neritina AB1)]
MTNWTSGYVAGIDYTYDFHRQLTPSLLGFTATRQGLRHGLDGDQLTYCELGCGQGFSANLLAAANPHIEFHAMDFSPSHIAGARELAQEAALDNIRFHERSFEDFGETSGLPAAFDIIALHGVYSWVSQENRQHILNFISDRLKPGGLVYVSCNTQPGWAASVPLRRILTSRAEQGRGTLPERISEAMGFARRLAGAGGGYFGKNPAAAARLDHLASMPDNYTAHEYFNKDWTPFFFEDLAAELGSAKLSFAGSVSLLDNLDCVRFTPQQQALLDEEGDPVRREGLRDVLLDEHFRSDVFVKGGRAHTPRGEVGAWFAATLALTRPYSGGVLKFHHRGQGLPLDQTEYAPVLQALAQGPATVRSLLDQGAFGTMQWGDITRMLTVLAGVGQIAPALPLDGLESRAAACRAFNLAICKRAEESDVLRHLASPVTGGGVELDRFEQLFLLARSKGLETSAEWADLAWRILAPQGQRLQHEGRVLETEEENLALLRARASHFAARRLPLCESLGLTLEAPGCVSAQDQEQAKGTAA